MADFGGSFSLASAYVELKLRGNLAAQIKQQQSSTVVATNAAVNAASNAAAATTVKTWKTKIGEIGKLLKSISTEAKIGFAAGTGGILGSVAAASPESFNTFTGSMKLAAGAIGMIFIPALTEVSRWLQNAANYIRGLSDESKALIAKWSILGLEILGSIIVIKKVAEVMGGLHSVMTTFGLSAYSASLSVSLMGAAALVVAYQMYKTMKYLGWLAKMESDAAQIPLGILKPEDMQSAVIKKINEGKTPEERMDIATTERDKQLKELTRAQAEFDKRSDFLANRNLMNPLNWLQNFAQRKQSAEEDMDRTKLDELHTSSVQTATALSQLKRTGGAPLEAGPGTGMISARQGPTPQWMDVADIRRRAMVAALSDPMEQSILQLQTAANKIHRESLTELKKISGTQGEPPNPQKAGLADSRHTASGGLKKPPYGW